MKFFSFLLVFVMTMTFWLRALAAGPAYDPKLPKELRAAIESDFAFVAGIKSSDQSDRHAEVYGHVDGSDYLDFFNSRIDAIKFAGENKDPKIVAFVRTSEPHTMWMTMAITTFHAPQAWRVATLWHESRHSETENGSWSHVRCPKTLKDLRGKLLRGPLSGQPLAGAPACDETSLGAYGITATMMGNLAKYCSNCNEKLKADAALIFEDGVNRLVTDELREELLSDLDHE